MNTVRVLAAALLVAGMAPRFAQCQEVRDVPPNLNDLAWKLNASPAKAEAAAATLAAMGPKAAPVLPELIRAMAEGATVRLQPYCKVFLAIGDPAIDPLIKAMNDKALYCRENVLYVLAQFKTPKAAEPFKQALKDKNPVVHAIAAYGLAELGEKEGVAVIPDLISMLDMQGGYGTPERENDGGMFRDLMVAGLVKVGAPAVEPLQKAANDRTSPLRNGAQAALMQMRDLGAFDRQMKELKSTDPERRNNGAMALGKLKDPRAFEPLAALLKDPDPMFRMAGAMALGEFADPRAGDRLAPLIKDQNPLAQGGAGQALGMLKDPRAVEPAIAVVKAASTNTNPAMKAGDMLLRGAAVNALGDIGDPRGIKPLIALIKNPLGNHDNAGRALAKIGKPAVEPLIEILNAEPKNVAKGYAIAALARIGDRRATEPLVALVRARQCVPDACEALVTLDDPRSIEPLIVAYEQNDPTTRPAIEGALYRITDKPQGQNAPSWRTWWKQNKDSLLKDDAPKN